MFDQKSIAENVSRWTGLEIKLPKELASAVEVFEALLWTEVSYQPVFDADDVTPANAEDKIRRFAEELALSGSTGGLSLLEDAKRRAIEAKARIVNALARVAVPEVIEQLTPTFNEHANAYIEAVKKLGPSVPIELDNPHQLKFTAENLVSWGAEAVAAYGTAQQEAQYLNRISNWVANTSHLAGFVSKDMERTLRILRPTTMRELIKLDAAANNQDPTLAAIDPVLFTAAKLGIEFGINTLTEASSIRESLESVVLDGYQQGRHKSQN
ncbi:hypothetical protein [Mycolicibacterium sp. HS_4_1]